MDDKLFNHITPHGANSSLIFTQPKRSVFYEAFSPFYINLVNILHVKNLRLKYTPVVDGFYCLGYFSQNTVIPTSYADYSINIKLLRVLLENECAR